MSTENTTKTPRINEMVALSNDIAKPTNAVKNHSLCKYC